MKQSLVAFSILIALSAPARADFSSCVAALRSDASAKGVSAATLDAAFRSLQPDMKVLDFEFEPARIQDADLGLPRRPRR